MPICQDSDLFSKVQSSYLWTTDQEQPNNVVDVPVEDLNICNGLLQAAAPRFSTITERAQTVSSKNVPKKEATATSLADMHLVSSEDVKSRKPWTPNTTMQENSQMPLIEPSSQYSRFAFLAKNGNPICQTRVCTIAFGISIVALCAIAIGVPLGFGLRPGTSTSTTTTTTTTSCTSTTSSTSTTTTPPATGWIPTNYYTSCLYTCITTSTVTPSTLIASWTFEENTNDVSGNGKGGQIVNGAAFTNGYIGQAIALQNSGAQFVNAPYINLVIQSFTVEAWINLNSLTPSVDLSILGQCEAVTIDRCLHYIIRDNKIYMGFLSDDLGGTTNLTTSVWYHVAYVYDYSVNVKSVYLNGVLDGISSASTSVPSISAYLGVTGNTNIGSTVPRSGYWDGLLDQVTITNRVKTPCEILNDASLVAYFPLDGSYSDIGPNSMTGTYNSQGNSGLSWVSGRVNQALNFDSSNSYFQSCGFYALGKNQPYSIAMWVNPSFQSGTLFHLSSAASGSGGWCLPMIGFSANGSIVVQTWIGSQTVSIMGPILPINTWTHIIQTYSSTNGLQLYINGGLYGSAVATVFSAPSLVMCVSLGSSGLGRNCQTGLISMGPYSGAIDEFYVYNRELNSLELCPLAHP